MKAYIMYYSTSGKYSLHRKDPAVDGFLGKSAEVEMTEEEFNQLNNYILLGNLAVNRLINLWWEASSK